MKKRPTVAELKKQKAFHEQRLAEIHQKQEALANKCILIALSTMTANIAISNREKRFNEAIFYLDKALYVFPSLSVKIDYRDFLLKHEDIVSTHPDKEKFENLLSTLEREIEAGE